MLPHRLRLSRAGGVGACETAAGVRIREGACPPAAAGPVLRLERRGARALGHEVAAIERNLGLVT